MTREMNQRPQCRELKVGDEVLVLPATWGGRRTEPIPAVVSKVARKYVTLDNCEHRTQQWRMRIAEQRENVPQYPQGESRFVTPEQHEYDQRLAAVDVTIKDAGIRLDVGPDRIWTAERRIALADLIISLGILNGDKQ